MDLEYSMSSRLASRSCTTSFKLRNETLRVIVARACELLLSILVGIWLARLGFSFEFHTTFLDPNEIGNHNPPFRVTSHHHPPRGTEGLPCNVIVPETDLYLHRLWEDRSKHLPEKPFKCLVTFTVGVIQKHIVNAAAAKFPKEWTLMLFHYDGTTEDWAEYEWSKTAIHVSVKQQGKWWYAKRFLHPDVVAPFDYIFIWDDDLGVEHFNAAKYIEIVNTHGLEISQPALGLESDAHWEITKRRLDGDVHKRAEELSQNCTDPIRPPCAAFVEIMAPVFSRKAWRCVWHMLQNDHLHGWGLDLNMGRCVEHAIDRMGVVDAQWIEHYNGRSLQHDHDSSTVSQDAPFRPWKEWVLFDERMDRIPK
ncbi:unnamed protein product [Calypogeia fissa]